MKYLKMLLFAVIVIAVVVGGMFFVSRTIPTPVTESTPTTSVATDMPSASTVPSSTPTPVASVAGWKTTTDAQSGAMFQYPDPLQTTYVSTVDWPPKVQVLSQAFTCTAAGSPIAQGGQTRQQVINGRTYCITEESEGAAGSTYRQYAYAFAKDYKVVILTFSLRFPQCANYDQPQQAACQQQQGSFDVTGTADQIAQTLIVS